MKAKRGIVTLVASTGLMLGAAAETAADPLAPGSRLCLYPATIPLPDGEGGERRLVVERKVVAALQAGGFEVADPAEVDRRTERLFDENGRLVDPVTGWRIPDRYEAYQRSLADVLRDEFGCDARAHAGVVVVRASYEGGFTTWDGLRVQIDSTPRLVLAYIAGGYESGWVAALSLWIEITDLEGNGVAFRSAGIEPLVRRFVTVDKDLLPEDAWLQDEAALDAAIASALGPGGAALRERGTPEGADSSKPRPQKRKQDR